MWHWWTNLKTTIRVAKHNFRQVTKYDRRLNDHLPRWFITYDPEGTITLNHYWYLNYPRIDNLNILILSLYESWFLFFFFTIYFSLITQSAWKTGITPIDKSTFTFNRTMKIGKASYQLTLLSMKSPNIQSQTSHLSPQNLQPIACCSIID